MTTPAPPAFRFCGDQLSLIGMLIEFLDPPLNRETWSPHKRKAAGPAVVLLPLAASGLIRFLAPPAQWGKLVATETKSGRRRRGHPARRRLGIDRVSGSGCITANFVRKHCARIDRFRAGRTAEPVSARRPGAHGIRRGRACRRP